MRRGLPISLLSIWLVCGNGIARAGLGSGDVQEPFRWSRGMSRRMDPRQTLRTSKGLSEEDKHKLEATLAALLRPFAQDNDISSESELASVVRSIRIKLIDLNGDGVAEVLAQAYDSRAGCGATGNCPFWVFGRDHGRFRLLLDTRGKDGIGGVESYMIARHRPSFSDLLLASHASATERYVMTYRWNGRRYAGVACHDLNWLPAVTGPELKVPEITDCAME